MVVGIVTLLFVACIVGYLIGRAGHFYYGHKVDFLHHWIYGVALILVGLAYDFDRPIFTVLFTSAGFGLFISDFKDFRNLKFYGRDAPFDKKFLGFD